MSFSDCTYCISAELKHWDSGDSVFCKLQLAMFRFTEFPICKKRNLSFCTYACPCLKRRTLNRRCPGSIGKYQCICIIVPSFCQDLEILFICPGFYFCNLFVCLYFHTQTGSLHTQYIYNTLRLIASRIKIAVPV